MPGRLGARPRADRPGRGPLSTRLPTTLALAGGRLELRRATADDVPALVDLLLLVAALDGDAVVGTLQLSFLPGLSRRGALRAQIEGVRVASAARSRGVGAAMVGWAVEEARLRGCALVQLTTDRTRGDALRFYERLGFVATHEGLKLHVPGPS